jgi:hypothetical protein
MSQVTIRRPFGELDLGDSVLGIHWKLSCSHGFSPIGPLALCYVAWQLWFHPHEAINRKPKEDYARKGIRVEKYGNNCWGLASRIGRKDRKLVTYSNSQFP